MKTKLYSESGLNQIYIEAENIEENLAVLKTVRRTKKPNTAHGRFGENGLMWAWINMPAKKIDNYDVVQIKSE